MDEPSPTAKKGLKEYLLEGAMIFVAVTLGFFAESFRENLNDNKKEREYIKSLISNLAQDTARVTESIRENKIKIAILDSILSLANRPIKDPKTKRLLYRYSPMVSSYYYFLSNDATMLQLKNGGLQYIKRSHIADSIAYYDQIVRSIYGAETAYEGSTADATNSMSEILIFRVPADTMYFMNGKPTGRDLPLLSTDSEKIEIFFNKITLERGWTQNYLTHCQKWQPFMLRLMLLLKKEYD